MAAKIAFLKSTPTYNLYPKIIIGITVALHTNLVIAHGGISAAGELGLALGWFLFFIYGIATAFWLAKALLEKQKIVQGYYIHAIHVMAFMCISIPWYLTPELNLSTALVLLASSFFVVVLIYHELDQGKAHCLVGVIIFVASTVLLNNPKILSLNNYTLSNDLPLTSNLNFSTITDPKYANLPGNRFMQTSDGRLFYSEVGNSNPKKYYEGIRLEESDRCRNPCFVVYGRNLDYKPSHPKAIFDFQKYDNSLESSNRPTALINIPLKNYYINRYSEKPLGVYSLVKDIKGRVIWNPASSWLREKMCRYGKKNNLTKQLLEAGADPNYRPTKEKLTTFYCAIKSKTFEEVQLLENWGGSPNTIFRSTNGFHYLPNALFLVLESRYFYRNGKNIKERKQRLRYLVNLGANINAKNSHGRTLLHVAIDVSSDDNAELIRFLLNLGAKRYIRNTEGLAPIDIAIERKNWKKKRLAEKISQKGKYEPHIYESHIKKLRSEVKEYESIINVLARHRKNRRY